MAIRNIITDKDPVLRKVSKPVTKIDENLGILLDDMKDTLIKANGAGLAAPQVGILKRVAIVMVNGMYFEMVNPVIIDSEGSQCGDEGCLSSPGIFKKVTRANKVTVQAFDRYGFEFTLTGEDLLARAIQHECDHLDGILFVEKAERMLDPEELGEDDDEG